MWGLGEKGRPRTLFSDRFQLGGPFSVRSFRANSLGPRDGGKRFFPSFICLTPTPHCRRFDRWTTPLLSGDQCYFKLARKTAVACQVTWVGECWTTRWSQSRLVFAFPGKCPS